jgi:hypothetical protein
MNIREHRGFGHGLRPGESHDMNCHACTREDGCRHPNPAPGTIVDRYGRECTGTARSRPDGPADLTDEQAADRYPLWADCRTCGENVACADGTAEWGHADEDAYARMIVLLSVRPALDERGRERALRAIPACEGSARTWDYENGACPFCGGTVAELGGSLALAIQDHPSVIRWVGIDLAAWRDAHYTARG